MYKSKLQELCHRRRWGLPEYSCLKDGVDHSPQFRASVSVNGLTFVNPTICKSSKDAHNRAALLALQHFTSGQEPSSGEQKVEETHKIATTTSSAPDVTVGQEPSAGEQKFEETRKIAMINSSTSDVTFVCSHASVKFETEGPTIGKTHQIPKIQSNTVNFKDDVQHQYKMKLQIYAKRNSLDSPSYTSTREGPPHALCFQSTVAINGDSFDSPGSYKTLKEAEHAAAQVALMSFSQEAFQLDDNPFYKNLLQELAQNEGFILPAYKTIRSGEPHRPTFFSVVEIEGEKFHGKAAKSKKQAEVNAAKAAYVALMKRMSSQVGDLTSPASSEEDESIKRDPASEFLNSVDPQGNDASGCPLVSAPTIETKGKAKELKDFQQFQVYTDEYQGVDSTGDLSIKSSVISQEFSVSPKGGQSSSMPMTPPDLSGLSVADFSMLKKGGTNSYLLCDRVRVYTCLPDIKFPKDTVVLSIGEDKWVPVSLEFPNEIIA